MYTRPWLQYFHVSDVILLLKVTQKYVTLLTKGMSPPFSCSMSSRTISLLEKQIAWVLPSLIFIFQSSHNHFTGVRLCSFSRLNCCSPLPAPLFWLQSSCDPWPRYWLSPRLYVFRIGASSLTKEGSGFLCRHHVCCTTVYPHCHGIQVTMDSVHPLSLHYTKQHVQKIYRGFL
jgi:hypothetical protein